MSPRIPQTFLITHTSPLEIANVISSLDDSKSIGPSPIPTKLLKIIKNEISVPLSDICNTSFRGVFPDKAKIAKVIPIHKKGSTTDLNNYRPYHFFPP